MFKVRSTSTPSYLRRLIQDREHGHNLRSTTTTLCQPFTMATFAKGAFRCSAPAVWNSLPKTVLNSDSVAVFKSSLKTNAAIIRVCVQRSTRLATRHCSHLLLSAVLLQTWIKRLQTRRAAVDRRYRPRPPSRGAHSSKPAARCCSCTQMGHSDRQTDGRTDARQFYRPFSALSVMLHYVIPTASHAPFVDSTAASRLFIVVELQRGGRRFSVSLLPVTGSARGPTSQPQGAHPRRQNCFVPRKIKFKVKPKRKMLFRTSTARASQWGVVYSFLVSFRIQFSKFFTF